MKRIITFEQFCLHCYFWTPISCSKPENKKRRQIEEECPEWQKLEKYKEKKNDLR